MVPVPGKGKQYQFLKRNCMKKGRHNAKRCSRKSVKLYYIKSKKGRERNKNSSMGKCRCSIQVQHSDAAFSDWIRNKLFLVIVEVDSFSLSAHSSPSGTGETFSTYPTFHFAACGYVLLNVCLVAQSCPTLCDPIDCIP